jgi:hypothetical protein
MCSRTRAKAKGHVHSSDGFKGELSPQFRSSLLKPGRMPGGVHPGVQTGGRQAGQGRPRNCGGGRHPGHTQACPTNWVWAERKGQLGLTADGKPAPAVTAEQAEIARLRAEVARLRMERDIAKKAATYFAQDVLQGMPGSGR